MNTNTEGLLPQGVADLVSYADGIPLPPAIKKSLWKAIGDLIAGAVDVPVAYLEAKAQQTRAEAQALTFITRKSAEAAAQKFGADEQLVERAIGHFGQKLFKEQLNREKVVAKAIEELKSDPPSQDSESDDEIDDDWLSMFSRVAEQKSNEDVQLFLAKILAGEIRKPGSYSPQTIHILSTLNQDIAKLFQIFCDSSYSQFSSAGLLTEPFGPAGNNALRPIGLSYSELTSLQDAGLIQHSLTSWQEIRPIEFLVPFNIGGECYKLKNDGTLNNEALMEANKLTLLNFTTPGLELRSVLHLGTNDTYVAKFIEWVGVQYGFHLQD